MVLERPAEAVGRRCVVGDKLVLGDQHRVGVEVVAVEFEHDGVDVLERWRPGGLGRVGNDEWVEASLAQGLLEDPVEVRREEDADPTGAGKARQRPVSRCGSPLVGAGR